MTETTSSQIRLRDPLSAVTRKERRSLLVASAIGFLMGWAGMVPEKMSGLGIEFATADQRALLIPAVVVVIYFMTAFTSYAISDFFAWQAEYYRVLVLEATKEYEHEINWQPSQNPYDRHVEEFKDVLKQRARKVLRFAKPVNFFRGLIDFLFPILVGLCAAAVLAVAVFST